MLGSWGSNRNEQSKKKHRNCLFNTSKYCIYLNDKKKMTHVLYSRIRITILCYLSKDLFKTNSNQDFYKNKDEMEPEFIVSRSRNIFIIRKINLFQKQLSNNSSKLSNFFIFTKLFVCVMAVLPLTESAFINSKINFLF